MTIANNIYDVIIIGGSYAGLSAAMALGRSLNSVLIVDNGMPCNRQTPHSHNFITQDGQTPAQIAATARQQVLAYNTVQWLADEATAVTNIPEGFRMTTVKGEQYTGRKLLLATGIRDLMPDIEGFAACWGISVLHCPYCHGYEVNGRKIGIIGNGDAGFEMCRLISNWSRNLVLLTNGAATLSQEQREGLEAHHIPVIEHEISGLVHRAGQLQHIILQQQEPLPLDAVFARVGLAQHSDMAQRLGCTFRENGLISIDEHGHTGISGLFAAGDNSSTFRTVSGATAAGTLAGIAISKELINEAF